MLTRSFCCFKGVSEAAERKLWLSGCLDWTMLAYAKQAVSGKRMSNMAGQLPELQAALTGGLPGYFLSRLPCGHRLRTWPNFARKTMFLDIETDGMDRRAEITVIGAWMNGEFLQFVKGRNLHEFPIVAGRAKLLITFNGIRFDWPMIERRFVAPWPIPHIDLMHEARTHGYTGGLKAIEKSVGIERAEDEAGDGLLAVTLWRRYETLADAASLTRLLSYNRCDVTSLIFLAKRLLGLSLANYPGPLTFPNCSLTS